MPKQNDLVNAPAHYTGTKFDWCDVARDWNLPPLLWNTLKYLRRYQHKGTPALDLKKGIRYIEMELEQMGIQAAADVKKKKIHKVSIKKV